MMKALFLSRSDVIDDCVIDNDDVMSINNNQYKDTAEDDKINNKNNQNGWVDDNNKLNFVIIILVHTSSHL